MLIAKRLPKSGSKLRVKWVGPYRVTRAVSDYVFECENLLSQKHSIIHGNRLKFYSDSSLNVTEDLLDTIAHNEPQYNKVHALLDLRRNPSSGIFEVKTQWQGFDHEEPGWEPFEILREDIPEMLESFLKTHPDKDLVKAAKKLVELVLEGGECCALWLWRVLALCQALAPESMCTQMRM